MQRGAYTDFLYSQLHRRFVLLACLVVHLDAAARRVAEVAVGPGRPRAHRVQSAARRRTARSVLRRRAVGPVGACFVAPRRRLRAGRVPGAVRRPRRLARRRRWADAARRASGATGAVLGGRAAERRRRLSLVPPVRDGVAHGEAVDLDDGPDGGARPARVKVRAEVYRHACHAWSVRRGG